MKPESRFAPWKLLPVLFLVAGLLPASLASDLDPVETSEFESEISVEVIADETVSDPKPTAVCPYDADEVSEPCVACTGCGFSSTLNHGRNHFFNVTPRVYNFRPGKCEADGDGCYPVENCNGTIKASIPYFQGEVLIDAASGTCHKNGAGRILNRLQTFTYNGSCGSQGTARFYWHQGGTCQNPGPLIDQGSIVLRCDQCQ